MDMVLDEVFKRLAEQSPLTVMTRAALEHALAPQAIDELFERVSERQYNRTLLFSSVVDLMAAVVTKIRPAVNAAYRVKIIDGNHLAGTEHRFKELRTIGAGALPGQALVVLDRQAMLATDVFPCEDGHAQERSLLEGVLRSVQPGEARVADRNFCTTGFLFGIARRGAGCAIRQHAATLHVAWMGGRRPCGRVETGAVFEQ